MPDLAGRHLGLLVGMDDADLGMALDLGPAAGMDSSSPNSRPNALCCSTLICWSRKNST
jgi:hypothetical protein